MKRNIYYFNNLLRTYNKYRRRLANLRKANRNERRQHILQKHIDKLFEKLAFLKMSIKLSTVAASIAVGSFAFAPQTANAQSFSAKEINPFSLTNSYDESSPAFADLDGDGDLDMLSGSGYYSYSYDPYTYTFSYEYYFKYYENIGTASNPVFDSPQINPFGIAGPTDDMITPTFADIDGDGDMDLFYGNRDGNFYYLENTGTSIAPAFGAPQTNPFGIVSYYNANRSTPTFADIDNDGDFDLLSGDNSGEFFYFKNTGTSSAPAFAAYQTNPFGLNPYYLGRTAPTFIDIDADGDFDLLSGESGGDFFYFENTGTSSAPAFAATQTNPFNLSKVGVYVYTGRSRPTFADIDNDGDMDLMAGDSYGDFNFYKQCTPTAATISPTAVCSYVSPSGLFHTANATFTDIIPNATGCDSVITINLTIESITDQTVSSSNPVACGSGSAVVDLGSSQNGVSYYLRDDVNDTIISGPVAGTGSGISLNTGNLTATTTFNVYGAKSSAIDLPANTDLVQFNTPFSAYTNTITIEAWVDFKGTQLRAGQSSAGVDNMATNVWLWDAGSFFVNDNGTWRNLFFPTTVPIGWTHVATVANASGMFIYYNGVLVASNTTGITSGIRNNASSVIDLGHDPRFDPSDRNTNHSFDNFRVWNTDRSASEVSSNMAVCLTGTEPGLVQYTRFEEGTGTTLNSITGVNGTIVNPSTPWITGNSVCASCDLEMTQTITINVGQPSAETISPTACNSYLSPSGNYTWTTSATYLDTIPNVAGCDSVITVNLTINTVDVTVDNSLMPTLSANQAGATYRWLDCDNGNAVIPSETGQTFTATANGNYAVEITVGSCVDTSACENITGVGISPIVEGLGVRIYPNPTNGMVNINLGSNNSTVNYSISSIEGKVVETGKTSTNNITVDLSNESKGVYFIRINTENISTVHKLIKQ
jgi:hypothetical protein